MNPYLEATIRWLLNDNLRAFLLITAIQLSEYDIFPTNAFETKEIAYFPQYKKLKVVSGEYILRSIQEYTIAKDIWFGRKFMVSKVAVEFDTLRSIADRYGKIVGGRE